jgi:uncharacterized protein
MEIRNRIISLDILRGVAVLGILIMNIQSMSMPTAAYINPTAYGDLTGLNKWIWILSHILANQKFMSIFSILFGAGVIIFTRNALDKGHNFAALHYRRMGWLMVFGLMHGYLLWHGDILFIYSLCGMLVFFFRKLPPRKLIWIGSVFFLVPLALDFLMAFSMPYWPEEAFVSTMENWKMTEKALQEYLAAYRGNWLEQMELRVPETLFMQTQWFFMHTFWRVMAMMLLGMALFKWKVLSAELSRKWYLLLCLLGLALGFSLSGTGVILNFKNAWSMEYSMFIGNQFNYVGSLATALGYIGLVMLLAKSKLFQGCKNSLAAVGRMAFTNYILMTLVCTFLFYGHGLGLFGSVERTVQALIVLVIWILLMLVSAIWLKRFRFGPLEAFWRSLTYGKWQALKK